MTIFPFANPSCRILEYCTSPVLPLYFPAVPRQPTGRSGAAAFGMPLPLAPLTATGDARDPPTMRTACVVVAATVTVMWWRGARSSWRSSWFALFLSLPFLCVLMGLLLCGGGACQGRGGRGDREYTDRMHHWRLFATTIFAPPLSCSTTPASPTS